MTRELLKQATDALLSARHAIRNLLQSKDPADRPKWLEVSDLTDAVRSQIEAALAQPEPEPEYDWMPEARQMAAQLWCDEDTKHIEMDVRLCEAAARRIAAWMQTGAFHARNEAYWRDRAKAAEADPPEQPEPEPVDSQLIEQLGIVERYAKQAHIGYARKHVLEATQRIRTFAGFPRRIDNE